ncbi:MAG: VOC family protein [Ktedonobacterales bacterium]
MPTQIDHVILATPTLAHLEQQFTRLGFTVTGGGTHPHLGTRNRLIVLDVGYIELLAVADESRVSPHLARRLTQGGGWVGFAAQSDEIAAEVAAMRSRGVDALGPQAGRLLGPDGRERGWRVATVETADLWASAEPLPFLIQHTTTGQRHREELAGADEWAPHPNGTHSLRDVVIATDNLSRLRERYAATYAMTTADSPTHDATLDAETLALPFATGHERIVLAQPTGEGIIRDRLATGGEGMALVTVAVDRLEAAASLLTTRTVTFTRAPDALLVALADDGVKDGAAWLRFVAA